MLCVGVLRWALQALRLDLLLYLLLCLHHPLPLEVVAKASKMKTGDNSKHAKKKF